MGSGEGVSGEDEEDPQGEERKTVFKLELVSTTGKHLFFGRKSSPWARSLWSWWNKSSQSEREEGSDLP